MIPGGNPFAVGTSSAGKRIYDAGLAFQRATEKPAPPPRIPPPAEVSAEVRFDIELCPLMNLENGELGGLTELRTPPGRVREIISEVAAKYGLSMAQIVSDVRSKKLMPARHEAMYRAVDETTLSIAAIGRVFRRDHTTVGHGAMRHSERAGLPLPRGMTWITGTERDRQMRAAKRNRMKAR